MNKFIYFICAIFICSACVQKAVKKPISVSFYHWKTALNITKNQTLLDTLTVQKLYVKFFDVDWDASKAAAAPQAILELNADSSEWSHEIVPTVFITNRVFLNISGTEISKLAKNVGNKITEIGSFFAPEQVKEWQFDCDWTAASREKYFLFLEKIKENINPKNIKLSVTIRLHQLKYAQKTGVPPADKGVLMCYNTGDLDQPDTENSILNLRACQQYFEPKTPYPLILDVALPVFSWGVLIRDRRPIRLMRYFDRTMLSDNSRFEKKSVTVTNVTKNTFLNGYYLYKNDVIRLESISADTLAAVLDYAKTHLEQPPNQVIFFDLADENLKDFSASIIHKITANR